MRFTCLHWHLWDSPWTYWLGCAMLMWYKETIFYRLSSKHSKAPVPRQKEPKQKGHKWKAEDDKEKTMLLILLICNLSCEYALISILCKHPDFNLVWQTIHTNLNVVSSTGVYVRRSITTWLCYKMFSGSCYDLFSTLITPTCPLLTR